LSRIKPAPLVVNNLLLEQDELIFNLRTPKSLVPEQGFKGEGDDRLFLQPLW